MRRQNETDRVDSTQLEMNQGEPNRADLTQDKINQVDFGAAEKP